MGCDIPCLCSDSPTPNTSFNGKKQILANGVSQIIAGTEGGNECLVEDCSESIVCSWLAFVNWKSGGIVLCVPSQLVPHIIFSASLFSQQFKPLSYYLRQPSHPGLPGTSSSISGELHTSALVLGWPQPAIFICLLSRCPS